MNDLPARCVREHACLVEMTTLREERDALREQLEAARSEEQATAYLLAEAEQADCPTCEALRAQLDAAREALADYDEAKAGRQETDMRLRRALAPRTVDHATPEPPCETLDWSQVRMTPYHPNGPPIAPTLGERLVRLKAGGWHVELDGGDERQEWCAVATCEAPSGEADPVYRGDGSTPDAAVAALEAALGEEDDHG